MKLGEIKNLLLEKHDPNATNDERSGYHAMGWNNAIDLMADKELLDYVEVRVCKCLGQIKEFNCTVPDCHNGCIIKAREDGRG